MLRPFAGQCTLVLPHFAVRLDSPGLCYGFPSVRPRVCPYFLGAPRDPTLFGVGYLAFFFVLRYFGFCPYRASGVADTMPLSRHAIPGPLAVVVIFRAPRIALLC